MRKTRFISVILVFCMLFSLSACLDITSENSQSISVESDLESNASSEHVSAVLPSNDELLSVHYLDVGQGDSVFIEFPDERCMLIDASVSEYQETIEEKIRALGYDRIDYVVTTHPHADHIGGMAYILDSFEIGCIYLPDVSASTKTYTTMAETILENNIKAVVAEAGVVILNEEDLQAVFLAPYEIDESDQNKNSAVLYLKYGETSFLFMGDADIDIEQQIGKVDCDVLKVGHHGSRTASDATFLEYASPQYAIISCGEGNSYGHPHEEAVARLEASGAEILRTDLLGDITIYSDRENVFLYRDNTNESERPNDESESVDPQTSSAIEESSTNTENIIWILNTSSKKIHDPNCRHVKEIAESNKEETNKSVKELIEEGYSACGTCKPHD